MAIPEVILELQEENFRENTLRCLSNFLLDKREEDPESYYRTGFLLFNSCSTMSILLQEVVSFYIKMADGSLTVRSSKRLINVLTLFQSIAANLETREKFMNRYAASAFKFVFDKLSPATYSISIVACVPNFLLPFILFESTVEVFESVRAISLSIIGILCQARELVIIQWAVTNNLVEVCRTSIEIGSELSKAIAMHILEAILRNGYGISNICHPKCNHLLKGLMETWGHLIILLAVHQDFSPHLLFHIIRCYVLLCNHSTGFDIVMENLPVPLMNDSFHDITEEFPVIRTLIHQLLLNVGKAVEIPVSRRQVHVHPVQISYDFSH